mmetsp:Transcript_31071/g.84254  ORF Transcript_31071/g.84254 Transcript_31071/m.84254 type:complete len:408 (+) Transcript_31071:115-1338(+)
MPSKAFPAAADSMPEEVGKEAVALCAGAEVGREDQGHDGLQLHDDVQGRTRGVLEGVTDGVTLHRRVVRLPSLGGRFDLLLGRGLLHVPQLRVVREAVLDVLLAVVPGAAGVGHGHGQLHGGDQGAGQQAKHRLHAEEGAREQGRADDKSARRDHLLQRGLCRDRDAPVVVRLELLAALQDRLALTVPQGELPLHLLDHLARGLAHGLHGEGGEPIRDHGTDEQEGKGDGLQDVDAVQFHADALQAHDEGAVQGQGHQCRRADGKALADGRCGVARGVQGIGAVAHVRGELRHLRDAAGVVGDRAEAVDRQARRQGREHAQGRQGDAVQVAQGERHVDVRGQHEDWDDAALVAQGHAEDDVHGGAGLAGRRQLAHGHVGVRREVLRDQADQQAADGAHGHAHEGFER